MLLPGRDQDRGKVAVCGGGGVKRGGAAAPAYEQGARMLDNKTPQLLT